MAETIGRKPVIPALTNLAALLHCGVFQNNTGIYEAARDGNSDPRTVRAILSLLAMIKETREKLLRYFRPFCNLDLIYISIVALVSITGATKCLG